MIVSGTAWYRAPWDYKLSSLATITSIAVVAVVTYGLTYLLTMIFRSAKRAIIGTLVVMTAYTLGAELLLDRTGIALPGPTLMTDPAHVGLVAIGWVLFAVGCPLVAQIILNRAEV